MEGTLPQTPYLIIEMVWQFSQKYWRKLAIFVIMIGASGLGLVAARDPFSSRGALLLTAVALLIFTWVDAALVLFFYQIFKGQVPRTTTTLIVGMSRLGPAFALVVITQLGIAAGLALFIIPGAWIAFITSLAFPAFILGELSVPRALRESLKLTTTHTGAMLRLLVIPWLFWEIVTLLIAGIAYLVWTTLHGASQGGDPQTALYFIILAAVAITRPMVIASRTLVFFTTYAVRTNNRT